MESIHGHEVMELIAGAGRPLARGEILQAVAERFGADARFHTCSAEGMTAEELLGFLSGRGKLVGDDGGLSLDTGAICNH